MSGWTNGCKYSNKTKGTRRMAKTKHKHQVLIAINVCNCILLKADSMHNDVRRASAILLSFKY